MNHRLVTVEEAAELVGVSVRTIRRWQAERHLEAILRRGRRCWFIDKDVYEAQRKALGGTALHGHVSQ